MAQGFNRKDDEEGLFAATPPLETLCFTISEAATHDHEREESKVAMVCDKARAFFDVPAIRNICAGLSPEMKDRIKGDMVAKLDTSLYVTKDAASNW